MKNLLIMIQTAYENLPIILVFAAVCIGIVVRVRKFMRLSDEEKAAMLYEQADKVVELIRQQLLSLVTKAEIEFGAGMGRIKKSWVWEQLTAQYAALMEYIKSGLIDRSVIDSLIEEAVSELEHLRKTNGKVAETVSGSAAEEHARDNTTE